MGRQEQEIFVDSGGRVCECTSRGYWDLVRCNALVVVSFLNRVHESLWSACRKLMKENNLGIKDAAVMRQMLFLPGGLELHIGMFIPSILSQGTMEQQEKWLPACYNLDIIGTYAQTELGHGTFLRGLETVAVYDPQTLSFIIHSPTLTSTKWWPGGLGKTATHAVVMARLITRGKDGKDEDYGPHAFVVQLRDLNSHLPLPGVKVGDIGGKMGYNGVDNGFLRFDHVRIPREHMLMKYAQVQEDGSFVPPPKSNAKASYATMVYVRATIIRDAGDFLGRAATIAVRYTAVRRQSSPDSLNRELQILDYDNVEQTLMPIIAKTYALRFLGENMMEVYSSFVKARERNDFSLLPELHAMSSGLKAYCTDEATSGIESCRRTCGGQGYSALSGLPTLYTYYVQNCTWEGDNNVMYLQMARYLLKSLAQMQFSGAIAYLGRNHVVQSTVRKPEDWGNSRNILLALEDAASFLARRTKERIENLAGGKLVFEGDAWNRSTVDLIHLAKIHCRIFIHTTFVHNIESISSSKRLSRSCIQALYDLCRLHGATVLHEVGTDILGCGHMSPVQSIMLRDYIKVSTSIIRPNAIAFVDSFGYDDYILNSAIGRKDGNVYKALAQAAENSPFNLTEEGPAWRPVLRHLLQKDRKLSKL